MKQIRVFAIIVSLSFSVTYAKWQNPVFLGELNDFQNGFSATRVHVSSDENCLFFTRSTPSKFDALWEAHRNPETGLYDLQRQLSELKNGGAQVYGVWMSEDKLRLYYAGSDPQNLGWSKRPIWLAIRNNPDAQWQLFKRHTELEIDAFQTNCTLTADEKMMMWETASFASGGLKRIFTATRPSILHNFSNIKEAYELEAIQAWMPLMSKDGLTVVFRILNNKEEWETWMGSRDSLDLPFGDFAPIEELNAFGRTADPCFSGDYQRLYFTYRPGTVFDINNTGIYVSDWVDSSYDDAVRNLHEAMADKEQAIQLIQGASEKEQTALSILSNVPKNQVPEGVSKKDIQKSVVLIHTAMQRQRLVQQILLMNLRSLESAWVLLLP